MIEEYPKVPIKFLIIDVFRNDIPENEGLGSPRFELFD